MKPQTATLALVRVLRARQKCHSAVAVDIRGGKLSFKHDIADSIYSAMKHNDSAQYRHLIHYNEHTVLASDTAVNVAPADITPWKRKEVRK
jgi:hypothetical protein